MNRDGDLRRERDELLIEAQRITRAVEPLLARREAIVKRANAITTLLQPVDDSPDHGAALVDAERMARTLRENSLFDADRAYQEARHRLAHAAGAREVPPRYVGGAGVEPGAAVASVITDILVDADRPLHREEIYQRSYRHPLGPLNRSTMVTRLSKDDAFENAGEPGSGFWALASWPPRKRRAIREDGREYAELLSRIDRERIIVRRLDLELQTRQHRLTRLRGELAAEGASDFPDPDRVRGIQRQLDETTRELDQMADEHARRTALGTALVQAATRARRDLGHEAHKYRELPESSVFRGPTSSGPGGFAAPGPSVAGTPDREEGVAHRQE